MSRFIFHFFYARLSLLTHELLLRVAIELQNFQRQADLDISRRRMAEKERDVESLLILM